MISGNGIPAQFARTLASIFLLFLIAVFVVVPVPARAKGVPALREHIVAEPVFGGKAYLLEAGRGNPVTLLLVHGLGDLASDTWKNLIPELAADYHVLAVDLPGFGRSEKLNVLYSPQRYATFLRWITDRYAEGPMIVVGHSLGGTVALRYAADYPRALQRLVLIDVAGVLHRTVFTRELLEPNLREFLHLPDSAVERINDWVGAVLARLPQPPLDIDQILASETLRSRFLAGDPVRIASLALVQEDFSPLLGQVRIPAVILWGAEDRVTPLRTGILLQSALPRARLQVIPGAGHVPMTEQPLLFRQALLSALTESVQPPVLPPLSAGRVGVCSREAGVTFSGGYSRIDITDCTDVRLTDVAAAQIAIVRSRVTIDGGRIQGEGTVLKIFDSVVTATGTRVKGDVALATAGSRLDFAGVTLVGRTGLFPQNVLPSCSSLSVGWKAPILKGFYTGSIRQSPGILYRRKLPSNALGGSPERKRGDLAFQEFPLHSDHSCPTRQADPVIRMAHQIAFAHAN